MAEEASRSPVAHTSVGQYRGIEKDGEKSPHTIVGRYQGECLSECGSVYLLYSVCGVGLSANMGAVNSKNTGICGWPWSL